MTAFAAPRTLVEALRDLAAGGVPVAGGTDLVVAARGRRRSLPDRLVSLHRLEELRGISVLTDGTLAVGALATHGDLERSRPVREGCGALADAAALVGSPATRHVATVGGNLANASPAMELGSPLLVHEAVVELNGGERTLPVADFLRGPGETALRPGELVTRVLVPTAGESGASAYVRLDYRRAMEIAVVGAAALVVLAADGRIERARVALTAVAPTCVRVPAVEEALRGAGAEDVAAAAGRAVEAAAPISDVRASERYRRAQAPVIVRRALELALERASA
jgi:aerobic carbon-monoxide dehydrogenase medium subunit